MGELHKCKYCGVETTQPDNECYAKPAKTMTAIEWFLRHVNIGGVNQGHGLSIDEVKEQAKEMFEQQIIDAHLAGQNSAEEVDGETEIQYFNKTFKFNKPICKCENTERIEVGSGSWNIHCKDCGKNW